MKSASLAVLGTGMLCVGVAANIGLGGRVAAQAPAPSAAAPKPAVEAPPTAGPQPRSTSYRPVAAASHASPGSFEEQNAVIKRYCAGCHNERRPASGLSLASFNVADAASHAEIAEKLIVKLQAGMMPPPGSPRPDQGQYTALIHALETTVDAAAAARPNPGRRTFQRLNRAEYSRAIQDLLGLEVDSGDWLPLDTMSANFDNIADEQALSPTLLEAYLNAAADISRLAVGDKNAPSIDIQYTNSTYASQHPWDRVPGAPFGTRGGMVVNHVFPADGEYQF